MSLREMREARKVTQETMAAVVGVTRAHYSRIENGQRKMTLEAFSSIVCRLGLSNDEIGNLVRTAHPRPGDVDLTS